MIKDIKEIIKAINRRKLDKINVFTPNYKDSENTKQKLYKHFLNNKVTNEKEILALLGFKSSTDKSYLMYLSRFKYSLLNLLFFIDLDKSFKTKVVREEFKALKFSVLARLLFLVQAKKISLKLNQKAILIAKKNDFAKIYADSMLAYISIGARLGIGSYLNKYIDEYPKIRKWANDLEILEFQLIIVVDIIISKKGFDIRNNNIIYKALQIAEKTENIYNDIRIEEIKFMIRYYYYNVASKYKQIEKASLRYESFILLSHKARDKHYRHISISLISTYSYLNNYEKGLAIFNKYKKYFSKNTQAYISLYEVFIRLSFLGTKYSVSKQILEEIYVLDYFKEYMPQKEKERWFLYQPYVLFAIEPNLLSKEKFIKFKYLYNNSPYYLKDKTNTNFSFLLAHYLFLLSLKDIDGLIDLSITFKNYNYKYFSNSANKRIYYFIKILYILYQSNFNKKITKLKSKKYLEKIKKIKDFNDPDAYYEIIPFEKLWKMILAQF